MAQKSELDTPMQVCASRRRGHLDSNQLTCELAFFIAGWMIRPMAIGTTDLIYEAANRHMRRTLRGSAKS